MGGMRVDEPTIRALRNVAFFASLSDDDLRDIAEFMQKRTYPAGHAIVQEDTLGDTFHVIQEGKVEIIKRFEDGEEMVLAVRGDGDFFGEMALLEDSPRSATVRTLGPATTLEISRQGFVSLLQKAPLLAYELMRELSVRLRDTDAKMIAHLQRKNEQLRQAYLDTVTAVANAIEARDPYTRGHTGRVTALARAIAHQMGWSEEQLSSLEIGALLHDVGKIGVADAILRKPGPLSAAEYAEIKMHPEVGRRMLQGIAYLESAIPGVLYHHERYDGQGYPAQLSGPEIPLAGRIMAVADAFDAMTSDRPYRRAMSPQAALAELERGAGTQFDPEVVAAFIRAWQGNFPKPVRSGTL